MKCERFRSLMDDYIDSRLDEKEIAEFKAHRECCPSCSALFDKHQQLIEMTGELKEDTPDYIPDAMARVYKLREEKRAAERRSKMRAIFGAVSAAAVLLIAVVALKSGIMLPKTTGDSAIEMEAPAEPQPFAEEEMNYAAVESGATLEYDAAPMEEAAVEEESAAEVPAATAPAEEAEAADEDNRGGFADCYVISVNTEMWELKEKLGQYPEIYDFSVFDEYSVSVTVTEMNVGDIDALLGEYLGDVTLFPGDEVVIELT